MAILAVGSTLSVVCVIGCSPTDVAAVRGFEETAARTDLLTCGGHRTPIAAVQGSAGVSPLAGRAVVVEGSVTADYQGTLDGFYLQDARGDGDDITSDGLFVYTGSRPLGVEVGEAVRVWGRVTEFEGLTELGQVGDLVACGAKETVVPREVTLPLAPGANLESLEGMLVRFSEPLTVTDAYDLARYGELELSVDGRLFVATHDPFDAADELGAVRALHTGRRVLLDDTRDGQDLEPIAHVAAGRVRLGDQIDGLTAVVSQGFGSYRLRPVGEVRIRSLSERPRAPADVGGELRVASFNVLNYFVTLGERGADTLQQLDRQTAKLVAALVVLDADVVALSELQNGSEAVQYLVSSLNTRLGTATYAALDPGRLGDDAIRVGMIYKPAVVRPEGRAIAISFGRAVAPATLADRPSLAQRFAYGAYDFTVVANHFKSKGCAGATGADLDLGQGCWNARRTEQAHAVLVAMSALVRETGDDDLLVLGDLNAYSFEDPVLMLETGDLSDLIKTHLSPEDRYTYVYAGEAGALDHALASRALAARVTGVDIWHINADEPRHLDYHAQASGRAPDPYRSSDHDPILVGLTFR